MADLPGLAAHADDTVTSVVDTAARDSGVGPADGDDRITHTAVRPDASLVQRQSIDDVNAGANDDQTDRVRIMARGNRDAILRARERAAQRRQPPRPMIEPVSTDGARGDSPDAADVVISTTSQDPTSTAQRMAAYERTPPVPRDEIESRGRNVSPATGHDDRFDSVPPIKADVELPRLRNFLSHEADSARRSSSGGTSASSSYDHVLRRAREIKASAPPETPEQAEDPSWRDDPTPAPSVARDTLPGPVRTEPPAQAGEPGDQDLVWDLDVANLNVAFTRVRHVLDDEDARHAESHRRRTRPVDGQHNHLDDPVTDDETDTPPAPEALQHLVSDEAAQEDFDVAPPPTRPIESPRSSWWRSLNFGMRRRVHMDRAAGLVSSADDEAWDDVGVAASDDRWLEHPDAADAYDIAGDLVAESIDDDQWEPAWDPEYDESYEIEEPLVAAHEGDRDVEDRLITSESSWREDLDSFPEAQPVSWHEERAALLARSPFGNVDEPLPPVPSFPPRAGQSLAPGDTSIEAPRQAEPVRRERRSWAVDQPGGLAAVRNALFHDEAAPGPQPVAYTQPFSIQRRTPPSYQEPEQPRRIIETREDVQDLAPARPRPRRTEPSMEPALPIRTVVRESPPREEPDRGYQVASGVRKCCLTCRSFQPTNENGEGRCGNSWSHTYKQMVHADALPCHSSIGDWWLADDLAWIPPETMIRPETPYTDRMELARETENEPSRQPGRSVRTRRVV